MMFWILFGCGFAMTLGMEVALGLCFALRAIFKGVSKK